LHMLTLGSLLGLAFYYQSQPQPPASGSAAGAPTITLEAMVISPTPPDPPPTPTAALTPPTIPMEYPPTVVKQPQTPIVPVKLPDDGVPVLPMRISKSTLTKTEAPHHTTTPSNAKPAAAAASSSYAPGVNILPHPPYPADAQSRGQTGTVVMSVTFDAQGNVTHAEVSESSGVPSLDATTKLFIRAHWHSTDYAGQSICQPVKYALENR